MGKHHKSTPNRRRKQPKAGEVAVLIAALGTLLTGLSALLNALK